MMNNDMPLHPLMCHSHCNHDFSEGVYMHGCEKFGIICSNQLRMNVLILSLETWAKMIGDRLVGGALIELRQPTCNFLSLFACGNVMVGISCPVLLSPSTYHYHLFSHCMVRIACIHVTSHEKRDAYVQGSVII